VLSQMRAPVPKLLTLLQAFEILVVDEFQDLDPSQFEFIRLFKLIQPALRVVAIGDMAQNIYRFRGTSNEFLRRLLQSEVDPELATFQLTTNFRSSAAILAAVNTVFAEEISNGHILPMVSTKAEGMKPRYYEYAQESKDMGVYEETVVQTLVPVIMEAKAAGKSVALIFPMIRCQSFELITALLNKYLPITDFHRIAKEDATSSIVEITYDPHRRSAPVQLSTFHASKGLEWDIVALINVSDRIYDLREGEVEDAAFLQEKINLLYVGMTRPVEQLLIFADVSKGNGRHRLLARLGESLNTVIDVVIWGDEIPQEISSSSMKRSGVSDLVRRLVQYPDIYARITACSEHIRAEFHGGEKMMMDGIYSEMKKRNREIAFGVFIDNMVKQQLTHCPTIQDRILEMVYYMNANSCNWIHRQHATSNIVIMMAIIEEFFEKAGNMPNATYKEYITATRVIVAYRARRFLMTDQLRSLYDTAESRVMAAYKSSNSARDKYILSQAYNLYSRFQIQEITAVDAREDSYKGLPSGFDEFAEASVVPAASIIRHAVGSTADTVFTADISVETESLICGEIDLMVDRDIIVEIKCSSATTATDLRGVNGCGNLLQLLAYVAIGRHGTLPLSQDPRWAILINPLTGSWEKYDLSTWSAEQSLEFIECLNELKAHHG